MKIIRMIHGEEVSIELTGRELFDAFCEQEFQFDLENVYSFFSDYTDEDYQDEFGLTKEEAEKKFEDIAMELRRNMDKYEMTFDYAISDAISDVMHGE